MIKINGETLDLNQIKLTEYLKANGYQADRIAIELNAEILPKAKYMECILHDGDLVEIVSFVGGG